MKYAVTGATGFVGSNLIRTLVEKGHEVTAVVRPSSKPGAINGVPVVTYDRTAESLIQGFAGRSFDLVFHVASLFLAEHQSSDIEGLVASNVLFGTHLLEAMSKSKIPFLVNTGTNWQNYHSAADRPSCLYAATKQAFEAIVSFYTDAEPVRAITLRLTDTYGPGDKRIKLFHHLHQAAQTGKSLAMSAGQQKLDLIFIQDAISAYLQAADRLQSGETKNPHEVFFVSSGNFVRLRDLVEEYQKILGRPIPVEWGGRQYRKREIMEPLEDGPRLPGWAPRTTLDKGLRAMGLSDV